MSDAHSRSMVLFLFSTRWLDRTLQARHRSGGSKRRNHKKYLPIQLIINRHPIRLLYTFFGEERRELSFLVGQATWGTRTRQTPPWGPRLNNTGFPGVIFYLPRHQDPRYHCSKGCNSSTSTHCVMNGTLFSEVVSSRTQIKEKRSIGPINRIIEIGVHVSRVFGVEAFC